MKYKTVGYILLLLGISLMIVGIPYSIQTWAGYYSQISLQGLVFVAFAGLYLKLHLISKQLEDREK